MPMNPLRAVGIPVVGVAIFFLPDSEGDVQAQLLKRLRPPYTQNTQTLPKDQTRYNKR